MASKKKAIWINYDFGLRGNYAALFKFLDNHKAKECGSGLAYFELENNSATPEIMIEKLRSELLEATKPDPTDRIYAIWLDGPDLKAKGRFIVGSRKSPPWNGYGDMEKDTVGDESI